MSKKIVTLFFLILTTVFFTFADKKGEEIARKHYDLKKSDDMAGDTKMILMDKNGNKQLRVIKMYTKEGTYGTNSFSEFLEPADVKGTKFLTLQEKNGEDVQRLYLPALKKVRRISSSNKDGKFMGSDLYYYDMEDHDYEDFTYEFVAENETLPVKEFADLKFYVLKTIPKDPDAPYSYMKIWIGMNDYFNYKTVPYDKQENPEKEILFFDVKNIDGVLIGSKTFVSNLKEQHKTFLLLENIKINTGLKDSIFEIQNLK